MESETQNKQKLPWKALIITSIAGFIYLFINFSKLLNDLIVQRVNDTELQIALQKPISVFQNIFITLFSEKIEFTFPTLMSYNFLMLWIYISLVILFAIRHKSAFFVMYGIVGIILGYSALHLISWSIIIVVTILKYINIVFVWIFTFFRAIFEFLFLECWWILLSLALLGVIYAYREKLLKVLSIIFGAAFLGIILYKYIPIFWSWLIGILNPYLESIKIFFSQYILPILSVVFAILSTVFLLLLILLIILLLLNIIGRIVMDQFKAAWYSGFGVKEIALSSFGIGSALAFVIITSIGTPEVADGVNKGWIESFVIIDNITGGHVSNLAGYEPTKAFIAVIPSVVEGFVFNNLTHIAAPLIDAAVLLGVICIASISLIIRIFPSMPKERIDRKPLFLPVEYFMILGGLLLSIILIALQALGSSEE